MPTYVTVSIGEPGQEAIPIVATSDPEIVAQVMQILAEHLLKGGQRAQAGEPED